MQVEFHEIGAVDEAALAYAVIVARHKHKWVLVRHKQRDTWEVPGGHKEQDEPITGTAARELQEETGATLFEVHPVCEYSVTRDGGNATFGRLFFGEVAELGELVESEIGEVALFDQLPGELTYPLIQPHLFGKVKTWLREGNK